MKLFHLVTTLAVPIFLTASAVADHHKKNGDEASLTGTYQIVSGQRDGKKLKEGEFEESTVRIAKNAITTYNRDMKKVYAARYEIDKSKKPWVITMMSVLTPGERGEGARTQGLIQQKGGKVKLIYALRGGEMPDDFKTDDNQQMFVLEKKEDKSEGEKKAGKTTQPDKK